MLAAVAVDPLRAGDPPTPVGDETTHTRAGDEARPARDRLRPVGEVGRRLRALAAALLARAALHARVPAVVGRGQDRVGIGPPVPAQACVRTGDEQAGAADRERWERRVGAGRVGRVAAEARHADLGVGALVVRRELLVGERPVVGDAVEGAHAEVGRQHAGPLRGVQHRAAADAVEVDDPEVGLREVDRVVARRVAHARHGGPLLASDELPVGLGAAEGRAVGPVALLEADDADARLGESPGHHAAGRARADDQDCHASPIGEDRRLAVPQGTCGAGARLPFTAVGCR